MEKNFDFGENWKSYLTTIDRDNIELAIQDLQEIFGKDFIKGKTFCDIGCGSGIHSLAALMLGAKFVTAFDINKKNIDNTNDIISKYWNLKNFEINNRDILSNKNNYKQYDVVYSWGVLHHTGNMQLAIKNTLNFCRKDTIILLALYEKTIYCGLWKKIKKFYNSSSNLNKKLLLLTYNIFKILALLLVFKNPYNYIKKYKSNRGMSFKYDQIDWLGGYPYESINQDELHNIVGSDFVLQYSKKVKKGLFRSLLGTGCSTYRFKKIND